MGRKPPSSVSPEQAHKWISLPLEDKVRMSLERIRAWYEAWDGKVVVSFSGGKDSTVLLHLVRSLYPDVRGMFINNGLEYPEVVKFVRRTRDIDWIRPRVPFSKVIKRYGYPAVSKEVSRAIYALQNPTDENLNRRNLGLHGQRLDGSINESAKMARKWKYLVHSGIKFSDKCCHFLKKNPSRLYMKSHGAKPMIGTKASDSRQRWLGYLVSGCNYFDSRYPKSVPIAFWTDQDVWEYLRSREVAYCDIYDKGVTRTGCMFCMFGVHLEDGENRFQLMKKTHPAHYKFCMNKLEIDKVLRMLGVDY